MKFSPMRIFCLALSTLLFTSCCTKWTYEECMEIDLPLEKTWEVATDLNAVPTYLEEIDHCYCIGEIETGATIYVKPKNIDFCFPMLLTEVEPYKTFNTESKLFLCKSEGFCSFEQITPEKTLVSSKTVINSPFVPFMKTHLSKAMERQSVQTRDYFNKLANEWNMVECIYDEEELSQVDEGDFAM